MCVTCLCSGKSCTCGCLHLPFCLSVTGCYDCYMLVVENAGLKCSLNGYRKLESLMVMISISWGVTPELTPEEKISAVSGTCFARNSLIQPCVLLLCKWTSIMKKLWFLRLRFMHLMNLCSFKFVLNSFSVQEGNRGNMVYQVSSPPSYFLII